MKKELFDWVFKKEKTYTIDEVKVLVEEIKKFNAGAIDEYLTNHVDNVFQNWCIEHRGE